MEELNEIEIMEREYHWFLQTEIPSCVKYLRNILQECKGRLPFTISEIGRPVREERLMMNPANGGDYLKCVATVTGTSVTAADVTFRISSLKNPPQMIRFGIPPEAPYLLQQLQDAFNSVSEALLELTVKEDSYEYRSAEEVTRLVQPVVTHLMRARTTLTIPKKRTFEELKSPAHRRHFVPPLPNDMSASFYIQAHKMIFALYQVLPSAQNFDCFQAEVSIPWLTEVMVLLTVALQSCQQLLDKVNIFTQNLDLAPKSFE
ncbi:hypothetical protein RvY_15771 [Ramazzottius varieornatus]|uniref:Uncharacterized protein n=1 Tax=Ramazzottius varieornatus TaxID=947166 RepID=A0A1D1VW38_RAMVA|nr:hypothetical protein RvY_15771 [Ramazzottius varieornatus]